ncbi:MAG: methyltransferase [Dissulfurispiraceae bacterium]
MKLAYSKSVPSIRIALEPFLEEAMRIIDTNRITEHAIKGISRQVTRSERTALVKDDPYCLIRHPMDIFQMMILTGRLVLQLIPLSLLILLVHIVCVIIKAFDEGRYLKSIYEVKYHDFFGRTERFFPKFNT